MHLSTKLAITRHPITRHRCFYSGEMCVNGRPTGHFVDICTESMRRLFRFPRRQKEITLHLTTQKPKDSKYHTARWNGMSMHFYDQLRGCRNYASHVTPICVDRLLESVGIEYWQDLYIYLTYK